MNLSDERDHWKRLYEAKSDDFNRMEQRAKSAEANINAALRSQEAGVVVPVDTVQRSAWVLECYAEYLQKTRPVDLDAHPYLPEIGDLAEQLKALLPTSGAVKP
jgi:hypothetical protein